jgi:hypothetical protein
MEVFKYIDETSNYSISNYGRVKSNSRIIIRSNNRQHSVVERILIPGIDKNGYERVGLMIDNKLKSYKVHRLVALNFLDLVDGKNQVNHIDGNKSNNNISNLEWVNNSENQIHSYRILKKKSMSGDRNGMAKLNWNDVNTIREIANKRGRYYGRKELSIKYNISEDTIKSIVQNKSWKI